FGDLAYGVYVQARVDLVEQCHLRSEHCDLEDLRPLLLSTRQIVVEAPVEEAGHPESGRLPIDPLHCLTATETPLCGGLDQKLPQSDTRDLSGVLETLQESQAGTLVDALRQQILAGETSGP